MNRQDLIAAIRRHEANPNAMFEVAQVRELAPGVLAVLDTDGEYAVFYDKGSIRVRPDVCGVNEISGQIRHFTMGVGLIAEESRRLDWGTLAEYIQSVLQTTSGHEIKWHRGEIVEIQYCG